jgi:ribosomal protein L44E
MYTTVKYIQWPVHENGSLLQIVSHCTVKQGDGHRGHSVTVRLNVRMGKTSDLRNFECGMIVSDRRASSSISEMAGLLGFSRMTVPRVYREWCDKQKKHLVSSSPVGENSSMTRGRRRMERTTRWSLSQMGYCSRRPHRVPLLSAKNKKKWLQWTCDHQHWTI